jgi:hypothetical protein
VYSSRVETLPFDQWSAEDWVSHYGPTFDPDRAEAGSIWDYRGRRMPGYAHVGPDGRPSVYYAGQSIAQRAATTVESLAQRGQQTAQSAVRSTSNIAHHGIEAATSPRMIFAGLAALGILGWVFVQHGRTVGRTIRSVAPEVGKTVRDVAPSAIKAVPLLAM